MLLSTKPLCLEPESTTTLPIEICT